MLARESTPRPARLICAFLSGGLAVLCLALWLRLTNFYSLPIFVDEAHLFAVEQPRSTGLLDGKFLLGAFQVTFQPWTNENDARRASWR